MPMNSAPQQRQRGVSLLVSLLLLIVLTLLGVSAMNMAIMEENVVHNDREQALGFQAAEAGLRDAENWISTRNNKPFTRGAGGVLVWDKGGFVNHEDQNSAWWAANGFLYGALSGVAPLPDVAQQPLTIIEEFNLPTPGRDGRDSLVIAPDYSGTPGREYYLVTGNGTGKRGNTSIILQSTYVKRY